MKYISNQKIQLHSDRSNLAGQLQKTYSVYISKKQKSVGVEPQQEKTTFTVWLMKLRYFCAKIQKKNIFGILMENKKGSAWATLGHSLV